MHSSISHSSVRRSRGGALGRRTLLSRALLFSVPHSMALLKAWLSTSRSRLAAVLPSLPRRSKKKHLDNSDIKWITTKLKSPYLKDQRLADVIAAIQVLSTYKFYKLDFKGWSKRVTGSEENAEHWKNVFIEHPEFFRLNHTKDRVSLAWGRSHQRT